MLIRFQSKASADVVMFDDVARKLLNLMDRKNQIPSAMYPEDIPRALSNLREAVSAMPDDFEIAAAADANDKDPGMFVSLKVRAGPLEKLLEASVREKTHVMWDVA